MPCPPTCSLLAQLLALARTEGLEEVLEVPIAAVVPVVLATQAFEPTVTRGKQGVRPGVGEIHMDARQTARLGLLAKGREQPLQPFVSPSRRAPATGVKGTPSSFG